MTERLSLPSNRITRCPSMSRGDGEGVHEAGQRRADRRSGTLGGRGAAREIQRAAVELPSEEHERVWLMSPIVISGRAPC